MNKAKAKTTAKQWIESSLRFAIFDCSDSMDDEVGLRNRFDAFVEDTVSIEDFVRNDPTLFKLYLNKAIELAKEKGESPTEDALDILRDGTPSELPIPFKDIERELQQVLNNPF